MSEAAMLCAGCFDRSVPSGLCDSCGFDEGRERSMFFLSLRTELDDKYLIGRDLGCGGFGITYLAWDKNLHIRVAIKEYLPRQLAERDVKSSEVVTTSARHRELFEIGLQAFIKEAQTVEQFQHQHIVRVRSLFKANQTAYMVMDYYDGETLDELLRRRGGKVSEAEAVGLLMPILDALREEVHPRHYLHRDISPHNIYLANLDSGVRPVLLDFGAARQALSDNNQALSVVLKPGYAPPEQYDANGQQGPWTDVYACAATLYQAVTGAQTPSSLERLGSDSLVPPEALASGLTPQVCAAILWGLSPLETDRPQTVESWQERLREVPDAKKPDKPEPKRRTESRAPDAPRHAPDTDRIPILKVIRGEMAGNEIVLEDPLILGRDPRLSQLVLDRNDLSRQHCSLRFDEASGRFELQDLQSMCGTFVIANGDAERLVPDRPVHLDGGARFCVVDAEQLFELSIEQRSTLPKPLTSKESPTGTMNETRRPQHGCSPIWLVLALGLVLACLWLVSNANASTWTSPDVRPSSECSRSIARPVLGGRR